MRVDRRTTLKWLLASVAASQVGCTREQAATPLLGTAAAIDGVAYGTDPDLANPVVPWSLTMTTSFLSGLSSVFTSMEIFPSFGSTDATALDTKC